MRLSSNILTANEAAVLHQAAGGPPHGLPDHSARLSQESLRVRGLLSVEGGLPAPTRQARAALDLHFAEIAQRAQIRRH